MSQIRLSIGADKVESILGVDVENWNALFGAVNALAVVVGIIFAVYNLRYIRRQLYFEAFSTFVSDSEQNAPHRTVVYNDFPVVEDYSKVDPQLVKSAICVINFLNTTATLIERDMLPRHIVLGLMHTVIIRSWFKLERYVDYVENKTEGRYARKVRQLDVLAKAFHDSRPHQRINNVCLFSCGTSTTIHSTKRHVGLRGIAQRVAWEVQFRTGLFFPTLKAR